MNDGVRDRVLHGGESGLCRSGAPLGTADDGWTSLEFKQTQNLSSLLNLQKLESSSLTGRAESSEEQAAEGCDQRELEKHVSSIF